MRKAFSVLLAVVCLAAMACAQSSDLAAMLDREVPPALERNHAPGAVVVVVRGGRVEVARGYGFADVDRRIAVDPTTTMFRAASVSKIFTATAVMQLVESGQLALNRDINLYIKGVSVPPYAGTHITLAHLLTHTAGFDDRGAGKSVRSPREARPLGEFLGGYRPHQFFTPGEIYSYSNLGMASAGYAVECASGLSFAEYQKRHILDPLGMTHSSWNPQPGPEMAVGYRWDGHRFQPFPLDYLQDSPAGQLAASGSDMAKFLLAQMGLDGSDRLFRDRGTAIDMQTVQFSHHAQLKGGAGWGWLVTEYGAHKLIVHDGGYSGTRTRLAIFPDDGVGIYIASNALTELPNEVFEKIVTAVLPPVARGPSPALPANFDRDVARFAGTYRNTRYSRMGIEKLGVLSGMIGNEMRIGATSDGMITMAKLDGTPRRMAQVGPGLFRSVDDDYVAAFRLDRAGQATHLFTNATTAFERTPWYLTASFQRILLLVLLGTFVASSFGARRAFRELVCDPATEDPIARWRIVAVFTATLNALYFLLWGVAIAFIIPRAELQMGFPYGLPRFITVVQSLTILSAGATVALVGYAMRGLFAPATYFTRLRYWVITLACGTWVWCMDYWNLLGWRY